jgi:hypothetical protein
VYGRTTGGHRRLLARAAVFQLELTNDLYEPHLLGIETCCVEYLVNSLDDFFFLFRLTFLLSQPLGMACVGA